MPNLLTLCALLIVSSIGFTNASEIPFAAEGKSVSFKQQDAGFCSSSAYVWSLIIAHLPLSLVESFILSILVYFLSGFTYDAGRFFFYFVVVWLTGLALSCVFRCLTFASRSLAVAQLTSAPLVATFFLFSGYLIIEGAIPRWLIWAYWISPYSWVLRSMAINEFDADRYNVPFTAPGSQYDGYRTGEAYMRLFDIDPTWAYQWAGVGYLVGFFLVMMQLSVYVLGRARYPLTTGTKRFLDEEAEEERESEEEQRPKRVSIEAAAQQAWMQSASTLRPLSTTALPFQPIDLAWRNIHYSVMVNPQDGGKGKVARKLLDGISGYARAGQLTALMGSSGAGKTTLMDVLAGRKTAGCIEGEILVNGHPKVTATFNRMCGFCEQTDMHWATQTVREALRFSAALRLPAEVTAAQREAFVSEVLDILELTPIADRIIGDSELPGLSPGQLKRVTIGVELVSNPPVLFLDEPTSGLDSRAALIVMRVVKRISLTGRAVLCTIHQPSAELFSMFDRLLLLQTGGQEVYFGDIGVDGQLLVRYFEQAPTKTGLPIARKPRATNPASWMLDVIGAGVAGAQASEDAAADYNAVYNASRLREENMRQLAFIATPKADQPAVSFHRAYASHYSTQFYHVTHRQFLFYWRNPGFVWSRQSIMLFLGCLLGFLYLQTGVSTSQAALSRMSAAYVGIAFGGWTMMSGVTRLMFRMRPVFYREQSTLMYTPHAYSFAVTAVELVYTALSTLFFVGTLYPMVGFISDGQLFCRYFFAQYLVMLVWLSIGQLNASWLPHLLVANILSALLGTFSLLFSGIFLTVGQMPRGWIWIYYMDWIPKALNAITVDQFSCAHSAANCRTYPPTLLPSGELQYGLNAETYIRAYLDSGSLGYWGWIGWQLLTLAVFRCLIVLAIWRVRHITR